ncbi:MAG: PAS domain S-box protein [Candidatus Methanoperedens sp.]|nr:PAS domain S-box protein [Candidatus Methanoperedens sp.]
MGSQNNISGSSFDGVAITDELGRFEFGNDSFFEIIGLQGEELIGKCFMEVIPEDMRDILERRKQTGTDIPYETKIMARDGEEKNLYISCVQTEINGTKKYVIIIKDISEQKKLELHLKESEARYRELFENADDVMYTFDSKGFFQTINNAGLKALGATRDEIIGSHGSKWIAPDSMKIANERFMKLISGVSIDEMAIYEIVCKNGEHKWAELRTRPIKEGTKITGIHGIARDITEKKRLEEQLKEYHEMLKKSYEELKESESRYRDLFENADDPMFTLDSMNCFVDLNYAGLKVLACSKEEVIGTHISKWLTPDSFEIAQIGIKKRLFGDTIEPPSILELLCKNGKHRWVEIRSRVLKDGGKITGIHGIARDITEKKRLEQQLKEYHEKLEKSYEKLKEADRLKTEFISNITHELLTPLTSIKGFAELLNDETIGKINDEQKKSLDIILRNSDRLIQLIKELIDAAYFEQNKFKLKFGMVSINNVISRSLQDMHPQANEKRITIIQGIKPLPEIWADEEKIIQVLSNLLSNAIKFTPQNGMISVTTVDDTSQVKISITDTGIGIPPDKLSRIFDRFYQIDGSASRRYGGMGIGLSICKSIIEGHYGSIWAESNGNGSTFNVTLPKLMKKKRRIKGHDEKS